MYRTFGVQTLTGSAQPLFTDKMTAAFVVPKRDVDPILTVANTAIYQDGDRIILDPGQADEDAVLVTNIINGTQMQVSSQGATLHAHAVNTVITLGIPCGIILINPISGNTGTLWIGADNTVTNAGLGSAFLPLSGGSSYNLGAAQWNPLRTTDAWMAGTLGDKVGIAAYVV